MLRAPLLVILTAVALGTCVAQVTGWPVWVFVVGLVLTLAALAVGVPRRRGVLVFSLVGFFWLAALTAATETTPPVRLPCGAEEALWRVRVVGPVGRQIEQPSGRIRRATRVALLAQRCESLWQPAQGFARISLWGREPVARGDILELSLRLTPTAPARNPTEVDPAWLARRDHFSAFAHALSPHAIVARGTGLLGALDKARETAALSFDEALPANAASIAKALSLGDRSSLNDALRERWADAGLSHLLSVSGLHVTIVAGLVYLLVYQLLALFPAAGERFSLRRAAAITSVPASIAFCFWVGAPPAAVRATVMAVAFFCGLALARRNAVHNALGLAGTAILLDSPAALYDPSFLLSFAAMLALLLLPRPQPAQLVWARLRQWATGLMWASVAASLATLPLTAYFFGRVSWAAPVTNLFAVPLGSAVATPLALVFALVAPLWRSGGALLAVPLEWAMRLLDGIAGIAAKWPLAVDVPRPTIFEMVVFALLVFAWLLSTRTRHRLASGVLLCALIGGGAGGRALVRRASNTLEVTQPYVGQGDATLVTLPGGATLLYDAGGTFEPGGFDPGRHVLAPLLRQRGVRHIDIAVVSHPHPDHLEGFAYIAEHFSIGELWHNGEGDALPTLRLLKERVWKNGGRVRLAAELPKHLRLGGVDIEVLHPRPPGGKELSYYPELNTNDNSIVLRLSYGERSILLAGDIEEQAEQMLAPLLTHTDILKVPHHGSNTSSTPVLLDALMPAAAIISCGEHNRFGFPDPSVLARYAAHTSRVLRTDVDGLIELETRGKTWHVRTQRGMRFRWPEP